MALFAALSYVIASSTRGSGGTSRENALLGHSQMVQYSSAIQQAINRMKLVGGCSDEELSFDTDPYDGTGDYYNAASPLDFHCHIFHPAGGGVIFQNPPSGVSTSTSYIFSMQNKVTGVGTDVGDTTSSDQDLLLMLEFVKTEVCIDANSRQGIPGIPADTGTTGVGLYVGSEAAGDSYINAGAGNPLDGREIGCFEAGSNRPAGDYIFYHVLLAR